MNDGGRSIARQRLAQTDGIGEFADFERTPLHRLGIAARQVVIRDGIKSGAA